MCRYRLALDGIPSTSTSRAARAAGVPTTHAVVLCVMRVNSMCVCMCVRVDWFYVIHIKG